MRNGEMKRHKKT